MRLLIISLGFLTGVLATSTPPAGAIRVPKDFKTIQAAVDSAQPGKTIFIEPGTYKEQVFVNKKDITIIGSSSGDSYGTNKVTITASMAQDKQKNKNNDGTATLRAHGDNFKLYNVNVVNARGRGSQALALSAYGDKQGYYGCQFRGFQDTILSEKGHHIFVKSLIQGATDFIFGMHGLAWFEKCDIRVLSADKGWVTGKSQYLFKLMIRN
jgi:pectinesterase